MITVIDQASPWLAPRKRLATTMKPQLGASPIKSGTGRASNQPNTSSRLRPTRSASVPAPRFVKRLRGAEGDDEGKDRRLRAEPKILLADQRQDAALEADHRPDQGIDANQ